MSDEPNEPEFVLKGQSMNTTNFLTRRLMVCSALLAAGSTASRAWAHHGWSSFDQEQPLYLEGIARQVRWRNPHAEFMLEPDSRLTLPADLASRPVPAQSAPVEAARLLSRARLPDKQASRWEIELAPLFRMSQWQIPEIRDGERVAAVGFGLREQGATPLMRVEFLFLQGKVYPMRSSPA